MKKHFKEEKTNYLNNKKKFITEFENQLGYKIKSVEFVENNEAYDKLCNALEYFECYMNTVLGYDVKTQMEDMITLVEKKKGMILKFQNAITFTLLNDGSHIRISPFNINGIEISRVYVNPNNHRKGIGSLLMQLLEEFMNYIEVKPEELFLECTGAVGAGDNLQEVGIDIQTKFFRKFGFKVNNGKDYPNYVSMIKHRIDELPV